MEIRHGGPTPPMSEEQRRDAMSILDRAGLGGLAETAVSGGPDSPEGTVLDTLVYCRQFQFLRDAEPDEIATVINMITGVETDS